MAHPATELHAPDTLIASWRSGPVRRPRLLLVENDARVRAHLRKHLKREHELMESARGDDALRLARRELPDAIVSEVLLPGLDGFALVRALKAHLATSWIPIVLLGAHGGKQSKIKGLQSGADDYLSKPIHPTELVLRIRNLLRGHARFWTQASAPVPSPIAALVESTGDKFRKQLKEVLDKESQKASFDVAALAAHLCMSRAHLHRRIVVTCHATRRK